MGCFFPYGRDGAKMVQGMAMIMSAVSSQETNYSPSDVDQVCCAFWVLRFFFALFSTRPHDSRKDIAIIELQESKFEGYCCHEAWPKITQNRKRKTQNKLDRHHLLHGLLHPLPAGTLPDERTDIQTWNSARKSDGKISRSSIQINIIRQMSRSPVKTLLQKTFPMGCQWLS